MRNLLPCADEFFKLPGPVAGSTLPPRGIEALAQRRVSPRGKALVEVCAEMANQAGVQRVAEIFAAEVGEQGGQGPVLAEACDQFLPQCAGGLRSGLSTRRFRPLRKSGAKRS